MDWLHDAAYLFGGAFLANAVPHFVSGMMGRPFQSPFAKPSGQGLSSSTVNVLWGFANFVVAYLLIARVGTSICAPGITSSPWVWAFAHRVCLRACLGGSTAAIRHGRDVGVMLRLPAVYFAGLAWAGGFAAGPRQSERGVSSAASDGFVEPSEVPRCLDDSSRLRFELADWAQDQVRRRIDSASTGLHLGGQGLISVTSPRNREAAALQDFVRCRRRGFSAARGGTPAETARRIDLGDDRGLGDVTSPWANCRRGTARTSAQPSHR